MIILIINHIVNPVKVSSKSDLFVAQPITFHSMTKAKNMAKGLTVRLLTTQYAEDRDIIPEEFSILKDLQKKVGDYSDFKLDRKLPLIDEIFSKLSYQKADYYIYTNVDIALQPSFYNFVEEKIRKGFDAFVINRRTISSEFNTIEQYEKMCADHGDAHPGFDCFIFKASMLSKFNLGKACLGANWIGRVIISNLIVHAEKFAIFEDEFQTFHIGDDRSWRNPDFADYDEFNRQEMIAILLQMRKKYHSEKTKMKYINEFLYKDMKWNGDGENPLFKKEFSEPQTILVRIKNKLSSIFK